MIGEYPKTFAFPEGTYNSNIINWVKQNGYIGARGIGKDSVEEGTEDARFPWIWASSNETNKYTVSANEVNNATNLSAFQKFRIDDKIAELTLIRPNYNANMPPTHYAGHLVIQTRQSIVGTYPLVNPAVSARIIESQKPVEQSPNEFDALRQSRSKIP